MTRRSSRSSRDSRFTSTDVRLGYVNGVFGLRGDVRLFLYNPDSDLIGEDFDAELVSPDGQRSAVAVEIRPGSGRRILARIHGVTSPEAAAALKDYELVVQEDHLPQESEGEWYQRDLLKTPVFTEAGESLGILTNIVSGPGMDTWVVDGPSGEVWVHVRMEHLIEVQPGERIVVAEASVLRLSSAT